MLGPWLEQNHHVLVETACRICPTRADADDLVNETAMALLERRTEVGQIANPEAFFYRKMNFVFVDMQRRNHTTEALRDEDGQAAYRAPGFDPDEFEREPDWSRISSEQLRAAVEALPDEFRRTFELKEHQRLPAEEIAALLGIKRSTVFTRLKRARERLKELLSKASNSQSRGGHQ